MLTRREVDDEAGLQALAGDWEALLTRSARPQPVQTPLWQLAWWQVFGPHDGRRLKLQTFYDGDRLVGIVPLLARRHVYRPGLPMERLELLASGEAIEDEIVSEYLAPIVERGRESAVATAFAQGLAEMHELWDELVLTQLDGEAPINVELARALTTIDALVEERVMGEAPYIPLPARWDDYLGALGSGDRYLARRTLRDFEEWAGTDRRLCKVEGRADLPRGKEILLALHEARWKAQGASGVFASRLFRAFHDRVLPALLDRGALDLRWIEVRGRPVAVAYNLVWEKRIQFYQGGRVTDVPKGVRPGLALHLYAIREAIETGQREYDFLSGTSRYKLQLSLARRPLKAMRLVQPSFVEAARRFLELGSRVVRAARERRHASVASGLAG